jgi:hypothetical protein
VRRSDDASQAWPVHHDRDATYSWLRTDITAMLRDEWKNSNGPF